MKSLLRRSLSRWRRINSLALAFSALVFSLALAACGSPASTGANGHANTTSTTAATVARCPLTDLPAPGNKIPQRPAIAMKVDNYSLGPAPAEARPQSGLDFADVIFEEQVEGAITRFAAVFQCRNAPGLVGPIRSARWTDIQMLSQLDHPVFVHVGGITPVLNLINQSSLVNLDLGYNPSLITILQGRYAPYNTYTSTNAVWAHENTDTTPPRPIFTFSANVPKGQPTAQIHLDWSSTSDIYWRWNAKTGTWLRFYNVGSSSTPDIQPDILTDGAQNQAQNVIVQQVNITYGPWLENSVGGLEAESHILDSSGKAYIFRNGTMIVGTWSAGAAGSPTRYLDRSGKAIALQPGRTWVEIYPNTDPVETTAPATAATATSK